MSQATTASFIRKTGIIAAIFNIVLNPFFAWLSNMGMAEVPLAAGGGLAMDTALTCLIMSFLISLFVSADTRRALKTGQLIVANGQPACAGGLLCRLPGRPWLFGLLVGLGAAIVVTPFMVGLFYLLGVESFSFIAFALFKAIYTPLLAYVVARWVILRKLALARSATVL